MALNLNIFTDEGFQNFTGKNECCKETCLLAVLKSQLKEKNSFKAVYRHNRIEADPLFRNIQMLFRILM